MLSKEKEKELLSFGQDSKFVEVLQKVQDETGEDIIGDLTLLNKLLQDQDKIDQVCKILDEIFTKNKEILKLDKIEMVRVDFGAKIDINTMPMHPKGKKRLSDQAFIHGSIKYKDGTLADLIYVNTVMIRELPEDLYTYAKVNPQFPDQSTADQFFDEKQFEAYRELGYQIGYKMCQEMSHLILGRYLTNKS